ncbi:MAG: hypothetical protein AMK72_09235, partial [Planctomycetes bacterium SM23_25]
MKRWTILVAFVLLVALAGARGVWGTPTGVSPGPAAALPSSESAAAPKPTEASPEAATDAAAAYKARQEAALKAKEFARTRRTLASTMRSRPGIDF